MGNLDIISLNIWHVAAALLNLLVLTWILKKFLFVPVQNLLAQRQAQVDTLYAEAEEANTAAKADRAAYEEKLAGAHAEAEEIVRSATVRADRMSDKILAEAAAKAADKMRKADADIAQEKKKALNDAKDEISSMAMAIAEKVVGRELNVQDQERLVDSFIDALGDGV